LIRFTGHDGVHPGGGASRRAAGSGAALATPISAGQRVPFCVEFDSLAPWGEAKAP
jgi:hypothetical protein